MKKILTAFAISMLTTFNVWAACTANIDLNNNRITSLGAPTIGSDAATKSYVDSTNGQLDLSSINVHVSTEAVRFVGAFEICAGQSGEGWRLPSANELIKVLSMPSAAFDKANTYWSTTSEVDIKGRYRSDELKLSRHEMLANYLGGGEFGPQSAYYYPEEQTPRKLGVVCIQS